VTTADAIDAIQRGKTVQSHATDCVYWKSCDELVSDFEAEDAKFCWDELIGTWTIYEGDNE
jgi:hypothetical protein